MQRWTIVLVYKECEKMSDVSNAEVHDAFWFLILKVMDMEITDDQGRDICPMSGFCENCESCFLDRYMETYPQVREGVC